MKKLIHFLVLLTVFLSCTQTQAGLVTPDKSYPDVNDVVTVKTLYYHPNESTNSKLVINFSPLQRGNALQTPELATHVEHLLNNGCNFLQINGYYSIKDMEANINTLPSFRSAEYVVVSAIIKKTIHSRLPLPGHYSH